MHDLLRLGDVHGTVYQLFKQDCTVKPLYSQQSRDPNIVHYRGVHPRGVIYFHAHMCMKYNVGPTHIKTVSPLLRYSSGGRAIFNYMFFLFIFYDSFLYRCTVHVFLID